MLRRRYGTFQLLNELMSLPATKILPVVGSSCLFSSWIIVDFPEPDGPTRKTNSPLSMLALASRSATTSPLYTLETPSSLIMTWSCPARSGAVGGGPDRGRRSGRMPTLPKRYDAP